MIASYILYFCMGIIGSLSAHPIKTNLQAIVHNALKDMYNVSYSGVLRVIIDMLLSPLKKCGVMALIVYPLILMIVGPAIAVICVIYCIPTVYLTFRLLFYCTKLMNEVDPDAAKAPTRSFRRKCSDIDEMIHDNKKIFHDYEYVS